MPKPTLEQRIMRESVRQEEERNWAQSDYLFEIQQNLHSVAIAKETHYRLCRFAEICTVSWFERSLSRYASNQNPDHAYRDMRQFCGYRDIKHIRTNIIDRIAKYGIFGAIYVGGYANRIKG